MITKLVYCNTFINKRNKELSKLIDKLHDGKTLTVKQRARYELLYQKESTSSNDEVMKGFLKAVKLNCPLLLEPYDYFNFFQKIMLKTANGRTAFRIDGIDYFVGSNFRVICASADLDPISKQLGGE